MTEETYGFYTIAIDHFLIGTYYRFRSQPVHEKFLVMLLCSMKLSYEQISTYLDLAVTEGKIKPVKKGSEIYYLPTPNPKPDISDSSTINAD